MLKLDGCYASADTYETGYPNMTKALNATGRPIVFSCSWPAYIKNVSVCVCVFVCGVFLVVATYSIGSLMCGYKPVNIRPVYVALHALVKVVTMSMLLFGKDRQN